MLCRTMNEIWYDIKFIPRKAVLKIPFEFVGEVMTCGLLGYDTVLSGICIPVFSEEHAVAILIPSTR